MDAECEIDIYTKDEYVLNTRSGKSPKNVQHKSKNNRLLLNEDKTIGVTLWANSLVTVAKRDTVDDVWEPQIPLTIEEQ
jgi:hypothetical protein